MLLNAGNSLTQTLCSYSKQSKQPTAFAVHTILTVAMIILCLQVWVSPQTTAAKIVWIKTAAGMWRWNRGSSYWEGINKKQLVTDVASSQP